MSEWIPTSTGFCISFTSIRMSMARLTLGIIGVILIAAAVPTVLLILLDLVDVLTAHRRLLVLVLYGCGVVAAFVFILLFRRSGRVRRVSFSQSGIAIDDDTDRRELPWHEVSRLIIRTDSDYARIAIRSARGPLTLMAAVHTMSLSAAGDRPVLQSVPDELRTLIRDTGFAETPPSMRAPGCWRYDR
ncbi:MULTISPECIES: hypothetical protein [unclassified Microbacterium]|uniref:hypothetical protein n=1 Tax=unclassified Microbacterium TaxID=2609290 RepID=UPI00097F514A|nr:hypothetical protein [Microbacterium sp. JB110]RCS60188.1 hypothetical protein CIK77_12400 [Microbacterium sp. JB110]SJM48200.1 hypothetical protein CZ774_03520 [Frigoribacterium sp. JB110]